MSKQMLQTINSPSNNADLTSSFEHKNENAAEILIVAQKYQQ